MPVRPHAEKNQIELRHAIGTVSGKTSAASFRSSAAAAAASGFSAGIRKTFPGATGIFDSMASSAIR